MDAPEVIVIDYGMGNLFSVRRALEHCGAKVVLTNDAGAVLSSSRLILPGVGSFADGMAGLNSKGLADAVRGVAARGTPLLGICLGMQMLFDESEEYGITAGLGLIPGRVTPIPSMTSDGLQHKVPHIGWNALLSPRGETGWKGSPLQDIRLGESVYFVHSFMAQPVSPDHRLADCLYGGWRVTAAVGWKNIWGCQFHPEKSGEVGLRLLRRFMRL